MALPAQLNSYLDNHYDGMSPEQLIYMLFKGALARLKLAKQGMEEQNIQKRGENLSKVIAIVSELNSSVDSTMKDEGTLFLKGLYASILTELPKASINNDIRIVERTELYLSKLKEIWETDVLGSPKGNVQKIKKQPLQKSFAGNYSQAGAHSSLGSISA